jgi:hypothetical protein
LSSTEKTSLLAASSLIKRQGWDLNPRTAFRPSAVFKTDALAPGKRDPGLAASVLRQCARYRVAEIVRRSRATTVSLSPILRSAPSVPDNPPTIPPNRSGLRWSRSKVVFPRLSPARGSHGEPSDHNEPLSRALGYPLPGEHTTLGSLKATVVPRCKRGGAGAWHPSPVAQEGRPSGERGRGCSGSIRRRNL